MKEKKKQFKKDIPTFYEQELGILIIKLQLITKLFKLKSPINFTSYKSFSSLNIADLVSVRPPNSL